MAFGGVSKRFQWVLGYGEENRESKTGIALKRLRMPSYTQKMAGKSILLNLFHLF